MTRSRCGLWRHLLLLLVETHPRSSLRPSLLTSWSRLGVDSRTPWSLPDKFAVPSAIGNIKCSPFSGVGTSFALSLQA